MDDKSGTRTPVTYEQCAHIKGPFFHGTRAALDVGADLVPGHRSNFQDRVLRHVYFTALVETAAWGAELAAALGGSGQPGRSYVVEPQGSFEDDPNVTDKKFPGNITQSYRTHHPLRVVGELDRWECHAPEVLQRMVDHLAHLREQGLDVIEN